MDIGNNFISIPHLLLLILVALLITIRKSRQNKGWKLPPGPSKLPVIGNLHQISENFHDSLWRLSKEHGPLMYLKLGNVPAVVISSYELANEVLKKHDLECCNRPFLVGTEKLSYGFSDVAFAPYGEHWKELRKIFIVELLNKKKVQFKTVREEETKQAMRLIASNASNSKPVNLSELLTSLVFNIMSKVAFGKTYTNDLAKFNHLMREGEAMFGGLFFAQYIPIVGWALDILTGMQQRLEITFEKFDEFYQRIIDDHLQDLIRKQREHGDEDTLDVLLKREKDKYLTNDCIKGLLMNILLAGVDTSSSTIGWTMTELLRQPDVMIKAQEEVRSCVAKKEFVEESDLEKFNYLKAVIKESMRKNPAVPIVPRETVSNIKLNGYDIPQNTKIFVNLWAIGRDPMFFENPEEFYPERFMGKNDNVLKLLPFGEGRRICPGKNLSLVTVELVLANLLYCFDWQLPHGVLKENISLEGAPGLVVCRKDALVLVPKIGGVGN